MRESGSGEGSGRVQQALPGHADGARLRPAALLARAAAGALDAGGPSSLLVGSALRPARRRRWRTRRRWRRRRRAASHVSRRELAVGRARHVHGASHRRRQELDAADRREDGSAREGHAGGPADLHADDADGGRRDGGGRPRTKDAHAAAEKLRAKPQSAANDALLKEIDAIAPPAARRGWRRWRRRRTRWRTWRRRWRTWRRRCDGGGRRAGRGSPTADDLATIGPAMVAAAMGRCRPPRCRRPPRSGHGVHGASGRVHRADGEVDGAEAEAQGGGGLTRLFGDRPRHTVRIEDGNVGVAGRQNQVVFV